MINYYECWKNILKHHIKPLEIIKVLQHFNIINNNFKRQYILCNANKSEPGVFIDRYLMLRDPHGLIEGIAILAICLEATAGYIYIQGDFSESIAMLDAAVLEAYNNKLLGKNILNSGYSFDLYIIHGAGSYISGEESALMEAMEGKKAFPRLKQYSSLINTYLYGYPAGVYDAETLVNIVSILQSGVNHSINYKMFSVSGHVNKPGIYKLPLGTSFKDLLIMAGGVKNNKKLKAVLPNGLSSQVVAANTMMQANLTDARGLIIMDETTCMVEVLLRITKFYMDESCGQCSPCREGTGWIYKIVHRIYNNLASIQDLEILEHVAKNVENNTICGLGNKISNTIKSFLNDFKQEFVVKVQTVSVEC